MMNKETKDKLNQVVSVLCDAIINTVKNDFHISEDHIKALEVILPNIDPATETAPAIGFTTDIKVNDEYDIDRMDEIIGKITERLTSRST